MSSNGAGVSATRGGVGADAPERVGPYRVKALLGAGGMGTVYLVENEALGRDEALKVPRLEPGDEAAGRERFLREAKAAARLDHPNLCPVLHAGDADGVCFLTMRYLQGTPLSRYRGATFAPQQAVELALALAGALAYAHSRDVLHRDLKPSNVMLCDGVGPVVMDFGLAKRFVNPDEKLTHSGSLLGTPSYAPPEQLRGDLSSIGPRSDVYSLGVLLFELLAGRPPFVGTAAEVIGKAQFAPAPQPSEFAAGLPSALDEACLRALEKRPEDRYESMAAFAEALRESLGGLPESDVPMTPSVVEVPGDRQTLKDSRRGAARPAGKARAALACSALVGAGLLALACALAWPLVQAKFVEADPDATAERERREQERLGAIESAERRRAEAAEAAEKLRKAEALGEKLRKELLDAAEMAKLSETEKLKAAEAEKARLAKEIEKQQGALADAAEKLKSVEAEKSRLEKDGEKQRLDLADAAEKLKVAESEKSRLEKEDKTKRFETERSRLEKEIEKQRGELASAVEKLKAAEAERARLEKENEKRLTEAVALYREGMARWTGEGKSIDEAAAYVLFRTADAKGHPFARARAGRMLSKGIGTKADAKEGAKQVVEVRDSLAKAAKTGDAEAQHLLGLLLVEGIGVSKDENAAAQLYTDAAAKGNAGAMNNLGVMYSQGKGGLGQRDDLAVVWYRKAAESGNAFAMNNLADMYKSGSGGLGTKEEKAVELYRKAAGVGHAPAMTNLGLMYQKGRGGLDKDGTAAVDWFQSAADRGDVFAMNNLGFAYEHGIGPGKELTVALLWYRKAAGLGNEQARQAVARLEGKGKKD